MKKRFNITGPCISKKHYMVNIDEKIKKVQDLIDRGDYFVINRPRQYGKTTLLSQITKVFKEKYLVIRMSFEGIGDSVFENEEEFKRFIEKIVLSGEEIVYVPSDRLISLGELYGFIKHENNRCKIHNRIFEQYIYNHLTAINAHESENISSYNFRDKFLTPNICRKQRDIYCIYII